MLAIVRLRGSLLTRDAKLAIVFTIAGSHLCLLGWSVVRKRNQGRQSLSFLVAWICMMNLMTFSVPLGMIG